MSSETVRKEMDGTKFLDEMLPASEQTALLFNISYLCLAKFPSLERLIRERAVESQMLFSSSETTLLQCVSTSENMFKRLLPMLKISVEKENSHVATQFLEEAIVWIDDIIKNVHLNAEEYKKLNVDVASATSVVVETKTKTEETIKKLTEEEEIQRKCVEDYKANLARIQSDLNGINAQIQEADEQFQDLSKGIASRNSKFGIATVVPIIGWLADSIQREINDPKDKAALDSAKEKLNRLQQDKDGLSGLEWKAQTELMKYHINLSRTDFEKGVVPSPTHLTEVQTSLSKIQKILLDLKRCWENLGVMLDYLNRGIFASKNPLEFFLNRTYKKMFLVLLEVAEKEWQMFGHRCLNIMNSLNFQSKDSYKFLEINPSSLSQEEWQKQYDALSERLNSFYSTSPKQISEAQKDPKKE